MNQGNVDRLTKELDVAKATRDVAITAVQTELQSASEHSMVKLMNQATRLQRRATAGNLPAKHLKAATGEFAEGMRRDLQAVWDRRVLAEARVKLAADLLATFQQELKLIGEDEYWEKMHEGVLDKIEGSEDAVDDAEANLQDSLDGWDSLVEQINDLDGLVVTVQLARTRRAASKRSSSPTPNFRSRT